MTSDLRKLVVVGLWQTGYYSDWICDGDEGEGRGRRFSSRDLLLALGWLLASGTLERLLTQRLQQLDKTVLTPTNVCSTGYIHVMLCLKLILQLFVYIHVL